LNLDYQGNKIDQIRHPKAGSSRRNDKERILGLGARPARRQGCNIAKTIAIEKQVIAKSDPSLDAVDFFSEQRVKGVCDSDRRGYFSGAACS